MSPGARWYLLSGKIHLQRPAGFKACQNSRSAEQFNAGPQRLQYLGQGAECYAFLACQSGCNSKVMASQQMEKDHFAALPAIPDNQILKGDERNTVEGTGPKKLHE